MRPIVQTRQLAAADPNGIALDQQLGAAGDLVLTGAALVDADGVAQLGTQRQVILESGGNIATVVFTVTGTDDQGRPISEDVTGINGSSEVTVLNFATVTQIAADDAFASDVEVGTTGVGASQEIPLDQYISPFNVSLFVDITGTVDVTVQFTGDDVFGDAPGPFSWTDHPSLTNITADDDATFISPVSACRLLTNSGVGEAVLRVAQAGLT
jgi:hypothetical protein